MRTLTLRIFGTTPLLLHRVSKHQLRDQIACHYQYKFGSSVTLVDIAEKAMCKDSHGNPVVPIAWLWDAIRIGCSRIMVEPGKQLSFTKVSTSVGLNPKDFLPLKSANGKILEWQVYKSIQHAKPGSKKMILVVAPAFRNWMFEVEVICYLDFADDWLLRRIFNEAGRAGIGLFHPPKKHFGQFRVKLCRPVA